MGTTYQPAKRDLITFVGTMIAKYHPDLNAADVTVGVLMAWNETDDAVKLHGYPCLATIQITPYKQRCQGIADAVITLDGAAWKEMPEPERVALIDHELQHLELVVDDEGNVCGDNAGRPKLRMRLHDYQLGGFRAVAERHKTASQEVKQAVEWHSQYYQQLFRWGDDMGGERETA